MARNVSRRWTVFAWALSLAIGASVFIGRPAVTADGAEVLSETLGFLVCGSFETPSRVWMTLDHSDSPVAVSHSRYGLPASILPLPFLSVGWLLREQVGALWLDRIASLTWLCGALFAAGVTGRLVRLLRPSASPFWVPAVLAGTFLLPYAAESFVEPWCAGFLGLGAGLLLDSTRSLSPGRVFGASLTWVAAALLKPVLFLLAPVFLLALALKAKASGRARFASLAISAGTFLAGAILQLSLNFSRMGSPLEFGYGGETLAFSTPLRRGLPGLLFEPGKGLLFYAPLAIAGLVLLYRSIPLERVLLGGTTLLLLLTMARWWCWNGALAWGPRFLLPVLPFMIAPAGRLKRLPVVALVSIGILANAPGAMVASGAWVGYVEALEAPPGKTWERSGTERVTQEWYLSPLYGHYWLLARGAHLDLPAPWLLEGARERMKPPSLRESLSPMVLRSLLGYPPVSPLIPRLLHRAATEYEARGEMDRAGRYRKEVARLTAQ